MWKIYNCIYIYPWVPQNPVGVHSLLGMYFFGVYSMHLYSLDKPRSPDTVMGETHGIHDTIDFHQLHRNILLVKPRSHIIVAGSMPRSCRIPTSSIVSLRTCTQPVSSSQKLVGLRSWLRTISDLTSSYRSPWSPWLRQLSAAGLGVQAVPGSVPGAARGGAKGSCWESSK